MKKILIVIGTRPNFIKVTQFKKEAKKFPNIEIIITHTGQHYDQNMSTIFFDQFKLQPDFFLNVEGSSVSTQIGNTINSLDSVVCKINPQMIMAVGDVNSTLCAAIVANKNNIPLAHLESGLRSNDKTMPEEINRILVDELTDHFFVTEDSGIKNLLNEGKNKDNIHFVGNTMIDTMVAFEKEIQSDNILEKLNIAKKEFMLMTLHRPSNVDNKKNLLKFVDLLKKISISNTVVIPFHPRTINKLKEYNLWNTIVEIENIIRLKPIGYFSFQKLISHSKMVITDSGGIQEETTFKNIPCITIRENTERPITISEGTNTLISLNVNDILIKIKEFGSRSGKTPRFWDGKATVRILDIINQLI